MIFFVTSLTRAVIEYQCTTLLNVPTRQAITDGKSEILVTKGNHRESNDIRVDESHLRFIGLIERAKSARNHHFDVGRRKTEMKLSRGASF